MKYKQGQSRTQIFLFPVSLDESIDPENEIRLIDLFVASLRPDAYGFKIEFAENGRQACHPADLLKLYIYGYLNKVCSSLMRKQAMVNCTNKDTATEFTNRI